MSSAEKPNRKDEPMSSVQVKSSFMGGATVRAEDVLSSANAQKILQRAGQLRQGPDAAPAPPRKTG